MQELWNSKFSEDGFLYGKEPNWFIKEQAKLFKKSDRVLCLGEGEGRNAIFLAKEGLHVEALDASDVGLKKLHARAMEENVAITVRHTLIENWQPYGHYEGIVSSYTHLPKLVQKQMFTKSLEALKSGGYFIAEFFSQDQINHESGGPKDISLLYNLKDVYSFFEALPCKILKLSQEVIELDEGKKHKGKASVLRIIIQKN